METPVTQFSKENLCWDSLASFAGIGPARLLKLRNVFGSGEAAYAAGIGDLVAAGIDGAVASTFCAGRSAAALAARAEKLGILGTSLVSMGEAAYPGTLTEIAQPPVLLYYRGSLVGDELALAVVGTRKISGYGRVVVPQLLEPVVRAGITIVSGLAFGVDAASHEVALGAGRRTVAVLGSSVDEASVYPREHVLLSERILECGGLLISEYPPGTPAFKHHFIARNRLIAGLSQGVLVVECDEQSGALITARHALDQGRTVYAVPGPVYSPVSAGPNRLIKDGATAVTSAADLLEDLRVVAPAVGETAGPLSPLEELVLEAVGFEPRHSDEITQSLGLPPGQVAGTLVLLELNGRIRDLGSSRYVRSPRSLC